MRTYRDLKVWRAGYEVALELHRETASFPVDERFEMARDLKKTSRSIIANIAEGSGRGSLRQQVHFLDIAAGSTSELECQVLLSSDLKLIPRDRVDRYMERIAAIRRMLFGMINALRREGRQRNRPPPAS